MPYKRFKYFNLTKSKKIRFSIVKSSNNICIIFLHGFMSDIEGEKPSHFLKFCKKKKINFLTLEYSGHGKSYGQFIKGNISKWTLDTLKTIKAKLNQKKIIFIGSSMGAWIALNLFKFLNDRIVGFIGIGSAPEFLEKLMWKKFSKKIKKIILKKNIYHLEHGTYKYPITKQIIFDGRKNKVFNKKINLKIPVTMFHGAKDDMVPINFSKKILKLFPKSKKKLFIIKDGEHSLSRKKDLKKISKELGNMISNHI